MRALASFAYRARRPLFIGVLALLLAAGAAAVLGESTVGVALLLLAALVYIPLGMVAASAPRAGLLWYGSYAEPWRAERSPGEPPHVEDDRRPT